MYVLPSLTRAASSWRGAAVVVVRSLLTGAGLTEYRRLWVCFPTRSWACDSRASRHTGRAQELDGSHWISVTDFVVVAGIARTIHTHSRILMQQAASRVDTVAVGMEMEEVMTMQEVGKISLLRQLR